MQTLAPLVWQKSISWQIPACKIFPFSTILKQWNSVTSYQVLPLSIWNEWKMYTLENKYMIWARKNQKHTMRHSIFWAASEKPKCIKNSKKSAKIVFDLKLSWFLVTLFKSVRFSFSSFSEWIWREGRILGSSFFVFVVS